MNKYMEAYLIEACRTEDFRPGDNICLSLIPVDSRCPYSNAAQLAAISPKQKVNEQRSWNAYSCLAHSERKLSPSLHKVRIHDEVRVFVVC
jgi:hypothetical protein